MCYAFGGGYSISESILNIFTGRTINHEFLSFINYRMAKNAFLCKTTRENLFPYSQLHTDNNH